MSRPLRVCLFVEYLYPVVSQGRVPFAGGIEVQLANLGRGLAAEGMDVTVVTCDFGQEDGLVVDGMRLVKCWPPNAGLPVARFFHPRLTRGIAALRRADADVYIVQGAALWAGIVCDVAHALGRRFLWLVGHDHDVMASLPDVHGWRDRTWVRRAIRHADAIVSQTEKQRRMLVEAFARPSTVIPNPVALPPRELLARAAGAATAPTIAWLATYKPSKRPEWFTRFAETHPDVRCRMAGVIPVPPLTRECWDAAGAVATRCPNLEVLPTVPHERVAEFLREATLFAHSSPAEGFPNTFLESWANGLPTVTAFDPDGVIERERLGACCDSYERWAAELERRLADPALGRAEGARARAWAEVHHAPDVIRRALAEVIRSLPARPA